MIQNKDYTRIKMVILAVGMLLYHIFITQLDKDMMLNYSTYISINLPLILYPISFLWLGVFRLNKVFEERRIYVLYLYTISLSLLFILVAYVFTIFSGLKEKIWTLNNMNAILSFGSSFMLIASLTIWQVLQYLLFVAIEESPETEEKT